MVLTDAERARQLKKMSSASIIGTAVEWYDYYLYGIASALIFGPLFFPGLGTFAGMVASFATFAVGFFVRPFGGLFFGILGDKLGRKKVLVLTLLVMGTATTLIGLVPDAKTIGWVAPVLLVLLRVVQGFGAGAEFGGAVLMCAETAPKTHRGFFSSLPQIGVAIGALGASGAFALVESQMSHDAFLNWGWRVPFVLSVIVLAIGLYIRLHVVETPVFEKLRRENAVENHPLRDVIRTHKRSLLVVIGARFADNGVAYVYQTVVLAYAVNYLHRQQSLLLIGVTVFSAIAIFAVPTYGALSDRWGRKPVYLAGAIFSALIVVPFFEILQRGPDWLVVAALVAALAIGKEMMSAAQASFFAELFDARVRYTGFATAREFTAIIGGLVPIVSATLIGWADGAYWPVAALLIGMISVTIITLLYAPETVGRDMDVDIFSSTQLPRISVVPEVRAASGHRTAS
jgi:MFS transporter, MHS family, shikimate and dehydroshikimate transport protein